MDTRLASEDDSTCNASAPINRPISCARGTPSTSTDDRLEAVKRRLDLPPLAIPTDITLEDVNRLMSPLSNPADVPEETADV